jgi:competence protein ComEC
MLYIGPWSQWTEAVAQRIVSPLLAKRLVRFLSGIAIATLAALLLTMLFMAYHFGQLSIVSPLANLFILPAQAGIIAWGILATLTGMVIQPLGQLLAWLAWLFLNYTIDRVRFFSTLPSASVEVSAPVIAILAIYAIIFGLTWLTRRSRTRRQLSFETLRSVLKWGVVLSGLATITWLILSLAFNHHDGSLHVAFIDVGQGDATLITTPSGRPINQNLLLWLNLPFVAKTLEGDECRFRYGRCFFECQIGRFQRYCIFRNRYILGITAPTTHG